MAFGQKSSRRGETMKAHIRRWLPVLVILGLITWTVWKYASAAFELAGVTAVRSIEFSSTIERAIELRVDQSNALSQLTILVLGGLIAVFLNEAGVTGSVALIYVLTSAVLLAFSFQCGAMYVDGLVDALVVGGVTSGDKAVIPDVFADKFDAWRALQQRLMLIGICVAAFWVVFVRNPAPPRTEGA